MPDVITFVPRSEVNARENLEDFVRACRNELTAFGSTLNFTDDVWDISQYAKQKARDSAVQLYFSKFGSRDKPMSGEFINFAKAYIRYTFSIRPSVQLQKRMRALQAVEAAMLQAHGAAVPSQLTTSVLNQAVVLLEDHYSQATAYSIALEIEALTDFLRRKWMLTVPITWSSPVARPANETRIGSAFEERRNKRLPSAEALGAIASIFRMATATSDVLVSSACAILSSAPDRISEVLLLPERCEATQATSTPGQTAYGLRWFPSKGGKPMVKWAVPVMTDILKEAISRIRGETEGARELARWYEQHPGKLYLPSHLEHLRGAERLSMPEVHEIVFEVDQPVGNLGGSWCRYHKLPLVNFDQRSHLPFAVLEEYLLKMLPTSLPVVDAATGMKFSEMLFVVKRNALDTQKERYRCVFEAVDYGNILRRLSGNTTANIFSRFGFTDVSGAPLEITTHQFRHYLNTLSQAGGLSQTDIALWSGRKSEMQNDAYDHISGRDLLALAHATTDSSKESVPGTTVSVRRFSLIRRAEWKKMGMTSAHTTEYGYCVHDFSMLPCQLHLDCINCDEQVCIKGDGVREENIRTLQAETRALLAAAEEATEDGEAGANRWVEHQRTTLARVDQLCSIFDDSNVPEGAAIRLGGVAPPTRLQQSADRLRINDGSNSI